MMDFERLVLIGALAAAQHRTACHDRCEQYQEWREFYQAEKDHDKQANTLCTIHKGDFDADTWHGKRRRRHR